MSLYNDALILADAILGEWWHGEFGDYDDNLYHCNYCCAKGNSIKTPKDMKHDLDCPVLVALDIQTGKR